MVEYDMKDGGEEMPLYPNCFWCRVKQLFWVLD